VVGAGLAQDGQLLGSAGGGDDGRAEHLAKVDGGEADAAAGAMHQQRLAGLDGGAAHQGDVGGQVGGRVGGGLLEAQPLGLRPDGGGGNDHTLGEAAVTSAEHDGVALAHARDAFAEGVHDAGALHARGEGEGRFELVFALDHQDVGEVHRRGAEPHAHLARSRARVRARPRATARRRRR
jgi:hypothetical protein